MRAHRAAVAVRWLTRRESVARQSTFTIPARGPVYARAGPGADARARQALRASLRPSRLRSAPP